MQAQEKGIGQGARERTAPLAGAVQMNREAATMPTEPRRPACMFCRYRRPSGQG